MVSPGWDTRRPATRLRRKCRSPMDAGATPGAFQDCRVSREAQARLLVLPTPVAEARAYAERGRDRARGASELRPRGQSALARNEQAPDRLGLSLAQESERLVAPLDLSVVRRPFQQLRRGGETLAYPDEAQRPGDREAGGAAPR
jgi:hypothetical protein